MNQPLGKIDFQRKLLLKIKVHLIFSTVHVSNFF